MGLAGYFHSLRFSHVLVWYGPKVVLQQSAHTKYTVTQSTRILYLWTSPSINKVGEITQKKNNCSFSTTWNSYWESSVGNTIKVATSHTTVLERVAFWQYKNRHCTVWSELKWPNRSFGLKKGRFLKCAGTDRFAILKKPKIFATWKTRPIGSVRPNAQPYSLRPELLVAEMDVS